MLTAISNFNLWIFILLTCFYAYQFIYAIIGLCCKPKKFKANALHRYAVIIAARNESAVLPELIRSIRQQNYPSELVDILVIADNCTDNTAEVARKAGAIVYERHDTRHIGKGYALDYLFKKLFASGADKAYEGYFIFDADNLLDQNYIREMNKMFDNGYRIITSYRNSKNFGTNWITAGYSLWFLREARYLNQPRMALNTSCAVSGTGFLLHRDIVEKNHGWKHHLLTEDIEFSVDSVIHGETIGYCPTAKLYDEQPTSFRQSWRQRLRWSKGFYQVFGKYGGSLIKTMVSKHNFACYDMLMVIAPALFLSFFSIAVNIAFIITGLSSPYLLPYVLDLTLGAIGGSFVNFYLLLLALGGLTTISEWKQIHAPAWKKILYTFTFPFFIFTYIPIAIVALFKKIEWKPIEHNVVKSLEDVRQ